ncbi:unnamed protein product, partial [Didymodactylos carnosus]
LPADNKGRTANVPSECQSEHDNKKRILHSGVRV